MGTVRQEWNAYDSVNRSYVSYFVVAGGSCSPLRLLCGMFWSFLVVASCMVHEIAFHYSIPIRSVIVSCIRRHTPLPVCQFFMHTSVATEFITRLNFHELDIRFNTTRSTRASRSACICFRRVSEFERRSPFKSTCYRGDLV